MKQDIAMLRQRGLPAVFGALFAGILLCMSLTVAFAARVTDDEVLLRSYFRFRNSFVSSARRTPTRRFWRFREFPWRLIISTSW